MQEKFLAVQNGGKTSLHLVKSLKGCNLQARCCILQNREAVVSEKTPLP